MKSITFDKLKPHLIAIGIMVVLSAIYFNPQLKGKEIPKDDMVSFKGAVKEKRSYEETENRTILWTNSMFGGMPTYQIAPAYNGNLIIHLRKVTMLFLLSGPIGNFICAMLCMYLFLCLIGTNNWLSLIGAIAFAFTTNNIVLWDAGHLTKIAALCYISLVTGGMVLLFRKRYLVGSILYAVGLSLDLSVNHVQMTYYFAICLVIFWIIESVRMVKSGEVKDLLKINGILAVCTLLAVFSTSTNYLATYEYQEDTMRGKAILATPDSVEVKSSSQTDGLEWIYATNWSNGGIDLLASLIPGVAGGSSSEIVKDKSAVKNLRIVERAHMYWGDLGSTSGPAYFGAIVCFLFLLGAIIVKGPLKWWLVAATVLTMMLSMGRHLPGFYEMFFNNFPLFNKFRAPNSILGVTSFFVATLAALALKQIYDGKTSKEEIIKGLKIAGGVTGGLALIIAFMGDGLFDIGWEKDVNIAAQFNQYRPGLGDQYVNALNSDRADLMRSDALRTFLFIAMAFGLIWFYLKDKFKANVFIIGIGALILIDLWGIDKRYVNDKSFESKAKHASKLAPRAVDQQILQDPDLSYRVLDLTVSTFNNSTTSYFHKTVGGYSAAKLQRYQDIIDHHISKNNSEVFDMLNTRYIIVGEPQKEQVQMNQRALGNAWFVDEIKKVETPNEEIEALAGFKAASEAVVLDSEFDGYVGSFNPDKGGEIKLTKYVPDRLEYKSKTNSEQFAVFSEIWYGPDKGWNAYVDGEKVDFVRANYVLRGMKIPAGEHTIEFKFEPTSFTIGKNVALVSSILILLLLGYGLFKLKDEGELEHEQE